MSGVGGYVRRCERVHGTIGHLRQPGQRGPYASLWTELPTFQCMPILSFVPFDVEESLDGPGMDALRSSYGEHTV